LEDRAERACGRLYTDDRPTQCGDEICAPDSYCAFDARCGLHCMPWDASSVGDPCTDYCRHGLVCIGGACATACVEAECQRQGFDTCSHNACVRQPHLGEACTTSDLACVAGTTCAAGTCVALRDAREGEPCDVATRCPPGMLCDPTTDVCATLFTIFHSCFSPIDCGHGQYCHDDGTAWSCSDDPRGSYCLANTFFLGPTEFVGTDECPDGFVCRGREGCQPTPADGDPCAAPADCPNGSTCVDARCMRAVMPWEPCGADAACQPWLTCLAGRCTIAAGRAIGDYCRHDGGCDHGRCVGGECTWLAPGAACGEGDCPECIGGVCQPYPGVPGTRCGSNPDICADGLWCGGGNDGESYCCS
jgi:hypothetical protein